MREQQRAGADRDDARPAPVGSVEHIDQQRRRLSLDFPGRDDDRVRGIEQGEAMRHRESEAAERSDKSRLDRCNREIVPRVVQFVALPPEDFGSAAKFEYRQGRMREDRDQMIFHGLARMEV